jgi:hypothetical protein
MTSQRSFSEIGTFKEKLTPMDGQVGIRKAPLPDGTAELKIYNEGVDNCHRVSITTTSNTNFQINSFSSRGGDGTYKGKC